MAMNPNRFPYGIVSELKTRAVVVFSNIDERSRSERNRGFALLVAVIFMTVMMTLGLALGSLSYKQQVLASSAIESQYAFYAADTALECALYADQQQNLYVYVATTTGHTPIAPAMTCNGQALPPPTTLSYTYAPAQGPWVISQALIPINSGCADVTIYKYPPGYTDPSGKPRTSYIFSQGYDVGCGTVTSSGSGARFTSRGLKVKY